MATPQSVSLTSLQDDEIKAFTRYTLADSTTPDEGTWIQALSGSVVDTPNMDYLRHGYVDSITDAGETNVALTEDTIDGYEFRRFYKQYGKAFRVTRKERRRGMVAEVEKRIRELGGVYNRMWPLQMLKVVTDAAAGVSNPSTQALDQVVLFSASHDTGSNTDNQTGITPASLTEAQAEDLLWDTIEKIHGQVDDQGQPVNEDADEFVVFCPLAYRRQFAYAVGAPLIIDGSGTRTNLLAVKGDMTFRLVTSQRFNAWTGTTGKVAVFVADGKTLARGRDPVSLDVTSKEYGPQHQHTVFTAQEERLAMAWRWESAYLKTFSAA